MSVHHSVSFYEPDRVGVAETRLQIWIPVIINKTDCMISMKDGEGFTEAGLKKGTA